MAGLHSACTESPIAMQQSQLRQALKFSKRSAPAASHRSHTKPRKAAPGFFVGPARDLTHRIPAPPFFNSTPTRSCRHVLDHHGIYFLFSWDEACIPADLPRGATGIGAVTKANFPSLTTIAQSVAPLCERS